MRRLAVSGSSGVGFDSEFLWVLWLLRVWILEVLLRRLALNRWLLSETSGLRKQIVLATETNLYEPDQIDVQKYSLPMSSDS